MNYKKIVCWMMTTAVVMSGIVSGCGQSSKQSGSSEKYIDLQEAAVDGEVLISEEGDYILQGSLSNGQIVVDAKGANVSLIFAGAQVTNEADAALYVKDAKKVVVTLQEDSENTLSCTGEYDSDNEDTVNAVIYSKNDLLFEGSGLLSINSEYGDGIKAKENLTITGGDFDIDVAGDGIDSSGVLQIDDGIFDILCAGGCENGETHLEQNFTGGGKMQNMGEKPEGAGRKKQGEMPEGVELPEQGEMPEEMEPPEQGEMPEGVESPEQGELPEGMECPERGGKSGMREFTEQGEMPEGMESPEINETSEDVGQSSTDSDDTISSKGIKSDSDIKISGGNIKIDSADDAIHSNGTVTIDAGVLELASGDDGIHAESELIVAGGNIKVTKCYEGLEGTDVTINDGDIEVTSDDDGLNAAGDTNETVDSTAEYKITINGGYLYVCANGDGIDSNGDIEINGGTVYVDGPSNNGNSAIDFGERSKAIVNGGTLVAVGSSGMAEEFDAESTQGFVLVRLDQTAEEGSLVTLTDESGKELISYTAAKTFNCVEISCAELIEGQTYTLTVGETSQKIEI